MSFSSEYEKLRKKRKEEEKAASTGVTTSNASGGSFSSQYEALREDRLKNEQAKVDNDLGPVRQTTVDTLNKKLSAKKTRLDESFGATSSRLYQATSQLLSKLQGSGGRLSSLDEIDKDELELSFGDYGSIMNYASGVSDVDRRAIYNLNKERIAALEKEQESLLRASGKKGLSLKDAWKENKEAIEKINAAKKALKEANATYEKYGNAAALSAEELYKLRDKADKDGDNDAYLHYQSLADNSVVEAKKKKLSEVKMDGSDVSILDEAKAVAALEDGDEKDARVEKLEKAFEKAGVNFDDYYSLITGDSNASWGNWWSWLGNSAESGLAGFNSALTGFADMVLGEPLKALGWENNPISSLNKHYQDEAARISYDQQRAKDVMGGGEWYDIAGNLVSSTTGALPHAAIAWVTGGASAAATPTSLASTAAWNTANAGTKALMTAQNIVSNPGWGLSFAQEAGGTWNEATEAGADKLTAGVEALLSGGINATIETGLTGTSGIQGVTQNLANGNGVMNVLKDSFLQEAMEETLQGTVGRTLGKMHGSEEDILDAGKMANEGIAGGIVGFGLGGGQVAIQSAVNASKNSKAIKDAKEALRNLNESEKAVVDKVYKAELAEREKDGNKLTEKQKTDLYDEIITQMDKGQISIDTIEEVLGGDTYKKLTDLTAREEAELKELAELYEGEELTKRTEAYLAESQKGALETQLSDEVYNLVSESRLSESYNERARSGVKYTVDEETLAKYGKKYRDTIRRAMESGVLNNTRRSHELVELVAKLEADKGTTFDFTNNKKLLESGFSVEGKTINGLVDENGVRINVDSKKYLNTVVGHEITHVLEGTELYPAFQEAVFEAAKAKGEYDSRFKEIDALYSNVEGYQAKGLEGIKKELAAELAGDYLFSDADFVKSLSVKNRNLFQKIFDEIKYLCKIATAGSKEARALEKAKKTFEDAYRAETKGQKNADEGSGVRYSITESFTDSNGTRFDNAVLLDTDFFDDVSPRDWGAKLREEVSKRASRDPFILPIVDENGNTTILQFANPDDRVTKDGGANHKVLNELSSSSDNISKLAVIHIDEIVSVSEENSPYYTSENNHKWLDKNGWLHRNANVINQKNGNIYNLTIDIAKAADGRTILYATNGKIKKVGNVDVNSLKIKGSRQNSNSSGSIPQNGKNVKPQFSLSAETDNSYLDAVNRGDTVAMQKMVDEAAEAAMPDSKIRDESGKLLPVYHGTKDMFYTFDTSVKGGVNGTAEGFGIYLSDSTEVTSAYGDRQIKMYADIKKPATSTKKTISQRTLVSLIKDTCERQAQKMVEDGEYDNVKDALYDTWISNYTYTYDTGVERAYREVASSILQMNDSDMDVIQEVMSGMAIRDYAEATEFYNDSLIPITGFDGFVTQWENSSTGKKSNIYLAFNSEQLKSADPVTKDDDGNVIPLSKRFNAEDKDIRHSLSENGATPKKYGNFNISGEDVRLQGVEDAPVANPVQAEAESRASSEEMKAKADALFEEWKALRSVKNRTEAQNLRLAELSEQISYLDKAAKNPANATKTGDVLADDIAPLNVEEQAAMDRERLASLTDSDMPPIPEAPYYEAPTRTGTPSNPFTGRDYDEIGKRGTKSFMEENPETIPYFQEAAQEMLGDLQNSIKGERYTINDADGYIVGWDGTKRNTTDDIADLLDGRYHYTYKEISDALNAIINGEKLNACAKRIEFALNDRLMNGYTNVDGMPIPANQEYIDLMRFRQDTDEAYKQYMDSVEYLDDSFAPVAENPAPVESVKKPVGDISPVKQPDNVPYTTGTQLKLDPSGEKVANVLTEEPKTAAEERSMWQYFMRNFVDKKSVFEKLSLKTGNRELQARADALHRADSSAQYLMKNGDKAAGVKSLEEIRKTVQESGKEQAFSEYVYHVHNIDRMSLESRVAPKIAEYQQTFKGMSDEQIQALSEQFVKRNTPEDEAARIRAAREYVRLQGFRDKPVFGDSVTADVSREKVAEFEQNNPEFKGWAQDLYKYTNYLRNMMVEEEIISQETADLWQSLYPHYVPIRRDGKEGAAINVALDTNKTGVNAPIKRATGGNADILPLFDTLGTRTVQTFNAIAKNRFGVELKNTLKSTVTKSKPTFKDAINSVENHEGLLKEGKDGMMPTFTVFENGERVEFEITEDMFDAMKPTSEFLSKNVLKGIPNKISNFRRGVLTEYNPFFTLTNAAKDVQDILVNSQHAAKTYANLPVALKEIMVNGKYYQEYLRNGGEQVSYFERDTNTFAKEKSTLRKVVGFPLDAISAANNLVERLPRLAEYIASRKAGRSEDVSMLDAARVTTNFAAGGDVTRFLNRNGLTFLNASVQGAAQQIRNIREAKHKGLRGWVGLAAKYAIAGLPAMLLNHMLWGDDDDYEELSDYVKQDYYILWKNEDGTFVRIPKGRTVSVIQNAFEQIGNLITGDDEVDFWQFFELVMNNLAPNNPIDNNIISPIAQAWSNTTWYGEDLVPSRLQDLPAGEQFDESTDAFSKWLGENTGISPYKINYLLDQYSGVVGDAVLPILTPDAERGDGNVFTSPFLDKFTTDPVMKNQNVSDFYTKKDEVTANANSSKATDDDILKSKYFNSISSDLNELYAQKREIQNDTTLSDEEKYAEVRALQQQIVDLTRGALNAYENVNIQGKYATVGDVQFRYYEPGEDSTGEAGWRKLTEKQAEKQKEVINGLGISESEYWSNKEEYDYAYEYPEKYSIAKAVGGYSSYKSYSSDLYDIKADKDASGKSINGSRKEKVLDYINNLDADYGEKIILFKSEYPSDDSYNYDIIDYLNGREDISYSEMETILKELGFTVHSDGRISW